MTETSIFSIGHGNRTIESFIYLLQKFDISYVIDVRTKPRSRFNPQYNKNSFSDRLAEHGIRYVFMGESLGGIPNDRSCYDPDGKVDYAKVKKKDFFLAGIDRIQTAYDKKIRIACVCSEISPCDCHRSKLIGESLKERSIPMLHINKEGTLEDQESVIRKILKIDELDLFSDASVALKSKNSYIK